MKGENYCVASADAVDVAVAVVGAPRFNTSALALLSAGSIIYLSIESVSDASKAVFRSVVVLRVKRSHKQQQQQQRQQQ